MQSSGDLLCFRESSVVFGNSNTKCAIASYYPKSSTLSFDPLIVLLLNN